jgi:hypothetical protein
MGRVNSAVFNPTIVDDQTEANAVSTVEGHDFVGDSYNAGNFRERARVGGQELSHVYGEENHRQHCKASSKCNIMSDDQATWDMAEYWIDESRCEVYRYYFHLGDEYEAGEPCPNWYQP